MKKKILTFLLASTTAMVMLVGCGNKTEQDNAPTPTVVESKETPVPTETTVPTQEPIAAPDATGEPVAETKVTLGQYKGLTIHEVDSAVIAEEIYTMLQDEYAELAVVDRAAEEGDTVNINYVGKKDGVAFEGGTDDSEEGTDLTLGSGQFIDGFEEGLVGVVAGEVRNLNLTFPENYGNAELAGQAVVFTVTVNAVQESVVPELTDEFAKENLGCDTMAEYVYGLYQVRNEESFYEQITEYLMESCTVENYPEEQVEAEKQGLIAYYTGYAEYIGSMFGMDTETALASMFGFESMEALDTFAEEYAYNVVKNTLVLVEIATVENLVLSDEEYQSRALIYAQGYGYEDVESFETDYGKDSVIEAVTMDYVMDYLISQSEVIKAESDGIIQKVE